MSLSDIRRDVSASALIAGVIVVLVGMTSSAVLVFQAARAAGVGPIEASSWLGSLCIGMGVIGLVLSVRLKMPVVTAWSTAGAALLAGSLQSGMLSDVIGAFVVSALLITLSGLTGIFERLMNRIPLALASGLFSGVLLHFALDVFVGAKTQPLLISVMLGAYVLGKRLWPKLVMLGVLIAGAAAGSALGLLHFEDIHFAWTSWSFVAPTFSVQAIMSISVPLFVVTMASQNLTGFAVMRANGFFAPTSKIMTWTGVANVLVAPFGGFALNLAAITAAIALGPEAHANTQKRYVASAFSSTLYILIGLVSGTVTSVFAAFPAELIMGIAGLALLTTIAGGLKTALSFDEHRDAAFVTFIVAASGFTLIGIGSAFWAIVIGGLTQALLSVRTR